VSQREATPVFCVEVHAKANKTQIRHAVEKLFQVKVQEVRTLTNTGKLRRRGRFAGYASDWKKAYIRLKPGQKVPEFAEV
jgi:large subunit ribosomal protein L23